MRLIPLISISLVLTAVWPVAAQQSPSADSLLPTAKAEPALQSAYSVTRLYTNRSLMGTYRTAYIPGLSTSGARGVGIITYDGEGHLSGYDSYTTFEGTYSVNPDGTGVAVSMIRALLVPIPGRDGRLMSPGLVVPNTLKWSSHFRIHPSGAIEFETVSNALNAFGPRIKTVGTQHKIDNDF
jgi:hypothetical protein